MRHKEEGTSGGRNDDRVRSLNSGLLLRSFDFMHASCQKRSAHGFSYEGGTRLCHPVMSAWKRGSAGSCFATLDILCKLAVKSAAQSETSPTLLYASVPTSNTLASCLHSSLDQVGSVDADTESQGQCCCGETICSHPASSSGRSHGSAAYIYCTVGRRLVNHPHARLSRSARHVLAHATRVPSAALLRARSILSPLRHVFTWLSSCHTFQTAPRKTDCGATASLLQAHDVGKPCLRLPQPLVLSSHLLTQSHQRQHLLANQDVWGSRK